MAFQGRTSRKDGIGGSGLDWLVHIRGQRDSKYLHNLKIGEKPWSGKANPKC